MKVCTCVLLLGIFAYANSISRIGRMADHRVVNVPQETVSEYSNEENSRDTNNLDNAYNFITRGTTLNIRNMKLSFRVPRVETLTDFIQEAVHTLNTYEDTAFEDFFHILDNEIRKYHYRGCKFSELTQNSDTRNLLAGSLKLIRGKSVSFTKANINEMADILRDETYDKNVKELLDYMNSLYQTTKPNFHSVLNELKHYRKTKSMKKHNDLVQFIRGGVRAILFDHYTELNTDTRRELKERIDQFWKQFKNNPVSSAEVNDIPYTDPVIKSVVDSIKAFDNPEIYSKTDTHTKLENKSDKIISIETYNEQFQDGAPDINESNNEFWKPATDHATDEISSGQSFDSSSNSIRNSQERHEEYKAQRYMTLYAEEISHKVKTTKKSEIISTSTNVMTRMPTVKKLPTTTSTPREKVVSSDKTQNIEILRAYNDADDTKLDIFISSHDTESGLTLESKHEPRAKQNYDKPQKDGQADVSRSKSKHKNTKIISKYDAVIDVKLTNTELLKSLRMFDPFGIDTKYDKTLYPRFAVTTTPALIRNTIKPRAMRAQAEVKPQKLTAPSKTPARYWKSYESFRRKQFDESKRSIVINDGHKLGARRSNNDSIVVKDFNTYVIKRIDALQNELKDLRRIKDFKSKMHDNNIDGVELSNVTDTFEAKDRVGNKSKHFEGNVVERLFNESHNISNEEVTKENNDGHTTRSNTKNTETTTNNTISSKSIVINNDAVNVTVIVSRNTSQVTNNNENITKEINKEVITNNSSSTVTSITNTTTLETVVTTPTVGVTRRTMPYSEPSYYDYPIPPDGKSKRQFDPFSHMSDGLDF